MNNPEPREQARAQPRAAVALAYRNGDSAPRVTAKGRGLVAEAIIARAREAGLHVHDSPELVALLMQVDLDKHVPPQMYLAVAEVLAWAWRLDRDSGIKRVAAHVENSQSNARRK